MSRVFGTVQKALQNRPRQVKLTQAWVSIHEDWGVGQKRGDKLSLSTDDFDVMRQWAIRTFGADPRSLDRDKDRVELSLDSSNEKLTRQRAFGRLLRVAVPGHGVMLRPAGGAGSPPTLLPTPPGALLAVEAEQLMLETEKVQRVLVIENAQLMERWWELVPLLPEAWQRNTLLAYRGHRGDLRSLIDWIKTHRDDIELGFYGDFDPFGIRIGLRSYAPLVPPGRFTLIGPDRPAEIPRAANKPDTFRTHEACLRYLEGRVPLDSGVSPLVEALRNGEWAVTQEALLVYGLQLKEYRPA